MDERFSRVLTGLRDTIGMVRDLHEERDALAAELARTRGVYPAGHYYSPLPDLEEVRARAGTLFDRRQAPRGIDLNVDGQVDLLHALAPFAASVPFGLKPGGTTRYYYDNDFFGCGDAIVLHCLMRLARPARIIEIGSGFSSAVMLDTNELFLDQSVDLTFIEPHPGDRLEALLRTADRARARVIPRKVQDLDPRIFAALAPGDILFIDSSHVCKAGSDVQFELFEILPRLAPGVLVHIHDIHYPFEYDEAWIYEGRAWNEAYLVRAFLMFNTAFRIRLFNGYVGLHQREVVSATLPGMLVNCGGSLWLERCRD